jgi:Endosomal/lysosomal potassium channel TMEM175
VLVRAVMPVRGVVHGDNRRVPGAEMPDAEMEAEFWESVRHNGGHYAAFLISFFAIAAAWRDHHDIFKYVRRVDSGCGRSTPSGC